MLPSSRSILTLFAFITPNLDQMRVKTRLGFIQTCNSATFNHVDGILGFGWYGLNRSASLLKTLSQPSRPGWDLTQTRGFTPMPRKFAFLANETAGELQLGGYDPSATTGVACGVVAAASE